MAEHREHRGRVRPAGPKAWNRPLRPSAGVYLLRSTPPNGGTGVGLAEMSSHNAVLLLSCAPCQGEAHALGNLSSSLWAALHPGICWSGEGTCILNARHATLRVRSLCSGWRGPTLSWPGEGVGEWGGGGQAQHSCLFLWRTPLPAQLVFREEPLWETPR